MPDNIPTVEPKEIVAGDTIAWDISDTHYPASTYVLTYALRGPSVINITAAAAGNDHQIRITAATSLTWVKPGVYWWAAYMTNGLERYLFREGQITIKENLAAITGKIYDGRTHVKKVLDAIEAVLEARATQDQVTMTIRGQQLGRTPLKDLRELRDDYKAKYNAEQGKRTKIVTRFNR